MPRGGWFVSLWGFWVFRPTWIAIARGSLTSRPLQSGSRFFVTFTLRQVLSASEPQILRYSSFVEIMCPSRSHCLTGLLPDVAESTGWSGLQGHTLTHTHMLKRFVFADQQWRKGCCIDYTPCNGVLTPWQNAARCSRIHCRGVHMCLQQN